MNAKWAVGVAMTLSLAFLTASVHAADMTYAELNAATAALIKRDFHDKGIATVDRLNQDEIQTLCSTTLNNPSPKDMERLQAAQEKAIKWPADGNYMGDWAKGEKLAQSGKGLTWKDKAEDAAGGNCYNCHQLSGKEISYGTIGPSLRNYGRTRGVASGQAQRLTYAHIYNAKAFNLCSNMPRFGHMGILTEKQIKDLVALLLDLDSPVNKE